MASTTRQRGRVSTRTCPIRAASTSSRVADRTSTPTVPTQNSSSKRHGLATACHIIALVVAVLRSSFVVAGLRDEAGGECGEQDPRHRARRAAAWSHSGKFPTNMNASCGSSCSIRDADSCCRSSESFSLWALRGPSTTMTTVWSEATSGDVLAHEDCCIRIARLIADVFMCNRRSMVLISFYIKI